MAGRPSKFTVELGAAILDTFRSGCYAATAAQACGVVPQTFYNWIERGQRPGAPDGQREFSDEFIRLDAEQEAATIRKIREAAKPQRKKLRRSVTNEDGTTTETKETQTLPGDVRALQWYAERRWPKHWAPLKGQATVIDDVDPDKIAEAADGHEGSIDELLADMPPELEEALLRNADRVRALLAKAP